MSLTSAYLITTKNLSSVINSVISAKAPERFTNKFLEDLGFTSSNDRLYVGVFKALGFLEENNQPTQRYFEFLDQTQSGKVLAEGIEEAYQDLFNLRKDAQRLSVEEVKNKLRTLTQGQKSDKVINSMANTFKALCENADWSTSPKKKDETLISTPIPQKMQEKKAKEQGLETTTKGELDLHYNIQIHLPETTNIAVYDAIFQSLRKHIM